ncbi:MAG: hypothetical protein IH795_07525 [Bacteroidetes bacterium]|nr:hypothetical protein [Bacteroidota bacterium]
MSNEEILNWVTNFKKEQHKVLFIYGDIGTGKFNFLKENLGKTYKINSFTYIDFLYNKKISETIKRINNFNNVLFMMTKCKKPIIVVKEVEFIKIKTIKNILKDLNVKNIKKNPNKIKVPIILIGSGKCIKIIKDLSDVCKIVKYKKDTETEIESNIDIILNNEEIKVEKEIKDYIVSKCDNYNKIKMIIDFIKNYKPKGNQKIKYSSVKKILELLINNIDYNTELYENVKEILTNSIKIEDIFNYYYLEKILLPLLIHENYKSYIKKNIKKQKDLKKCIRLIADNLMKGDIINEFIFQNHVWNIQDLYAIMNCQYTSYIMNKKFDTKKKKTLLKLDYTKILTKNSILFLNFKQYKNETSINSNI